MRIGRFSPIDDDEPCWNSDEYEAGYQARQGGAAASMTATRNWRAGWADADMDFLSGRGLIEARDRVQ